ncbi:MAG: (Fe-S)-binding protein [Acidimicrobiales bacterium]|nr:(Fe-S)-binding protein [Acidimicrobiales bacterium]
MSTGRVLPVDMDELAACVSCGLCLAHCPTFRVTGEESRSPRGRIAAMRAVEADGMAGPAFREMIDTCVGCRACESACPSSVPFGHLLEASRRTLAERGVPWWQRLAYRALGHHRLLVSLSRLGAVGQRTGLLPARLGARLGLPSLPLRQAALEPTGDDVWLFTGCVMDAWQRSVHRDAMAVLASMGVGVALPGPQAACCGALQSHAGLHRQAVRLARRVIAAFPGSAPVLVDSAGCGAALKEYGYLLDSGEGERFAARVFDIQEWIAAHADRLPPPVPGWVPLRVALQDPCHLRHAQRAERHVGTVLRPYAVLVELTDEGRCCGAGGAYSVMQPELAGRIRGQKMEVIAAAQADVVASPNPGCALWLAAAGARVMHPMEIVARAAGLGPSPRQELSQNSREGEGGGSSLTNRSHRGEGTSRRLLPPGNSFATAPQEA